MLIYVDGAAYLCRRVEKRSRGGERGSLGDGQRRRSPRLSSSTSTSSRPPQIIDGNCSGQSDNNHGAVVGSVTFTNARGTTSKELFGYGLVHPKHDQLSVLCDSNNNEEDNEKLVPDRNSCATPYSIKHELKQSLTRPGPLHRYLIAPSLQWCI